MSDLKAQIRQFCSTYLLRLNTDLGQHFLVDQLILDEIVEAAQITDEDRIVEIGPGIGVLTKELLERAGHVTAIELDERMIPLLHEYVRANTKLEVINENALKVPMPSEPYKMVANIPYHITSPLLQHVFLESETFPTSMTLLIQKEVADRICDTKNASMLTVIVALFGKASKVINVPPSAFLPPPKVDSAVIHIDCYKEPLADKATIEQILKLTKIGFSQKRKMLRNSFGTFPEGLELLSAAGIDETRRPQTLSVDEWIALAKIAAQN
ncbi:MAG: ribosomal RNA small subunit methyltransferase A [Candidatus Peribacter sp.]|jgi:16S rRNA (adenine1518-N6/adenine1519-N6)-dimethyltransferase|nr:ribosomal RNA small subunit methyltransferase A [Candidatus Peribacter sp.]MBT4393362.1 ribosomal RNA small subunit methyltransferase A [Candidatus Peribacter sp.]MBT4600799.1 ribosomal RNA small subunit methyltransferase A [Candidatus Peribacter sp.]MBT5149155.1 ribosomal RNA small subunit methyltransferase A [Candidatus Peribacter sp.]MBT5637872.1 ribosomal RNA small subunit methyltransferase A [Candidatus Peribacter sp.]